MASLNQREKPINKDKKMTSIIGRIIKFKNRFISIEPKETYYEDVPEPVGDGYPHALISHLKTNTR